MKETKKELIPKFESFYHCKFTESSKTSFEIELLDNKGNPINYKIMYRDRHLYILNFECEDLIGLPVDMITDTCTIANDFYKEKHNEK